MPLVGNGDDVRVEYEIPKEIAERIPDYFYFALAGELFGTAGYENGLYMFTDRSEDTNGEYHNFDSGTSGWYVAFMMTCKKLDMLWLLEYYNGLPWYDSDIFDGIMEENIEKRFVRESSAGWNCYYGYLLTVEKELRNKVNKEVLR